MLDYNLLDKLLHQLFLGNIFIKETCFELEKYFFLNNCEDFTLNNHIFISGMPRAGSTVLLNFIYSSNNFASLTYKDMPFLMSPNLLSFLKTKKNFKKKRFHNDDISINTMSPEALDQAFLATFSKKELSKNYKDYINLILNNYKRKRYISKNNNLLNNLNMIVEDFKNSDILILLRDPIQQSNSLLNKHIQFTNMQKENNFILKYMNFLGHHEFGLGHKSWFLSKKYDNKNSIDYWLEQWLLYFENILSLLGKNNRISFIDYEKLCTNKIYQMETSEKFNFKYLDPHLKYPKNKDVKFDDKSYKNKAYDLFNYFKNN